MKLPNNILKTIGVTTIDGLGKLKGGTPMTKRNLPQPFGVDKIHFRDCFTAPSLRHFAALITGWALTVGTRTISKVILATGAHESEHFANIYKFLGRSNWDPDKVAFEVFKLIIERLLPGCTVIEIVIDDTLNSCVGKKIFGAGVQHDGNAPKTGKPIGYGVCFVIIGVAVRLPRISDRAFCLPYAARLWWPAKAKVKPKAAVYKTKPQLAEELIRLTHSWIDSSIIIRAIVDGGYSNKNLIQDRPKGVHITGKLRMDAVLYDLEEPEAGKKGRPRKKGPRLPVRKSIFNSGDTLWDWNRIKLYGHRTTVLVHRFNAIWYKAPGNEPLSIVLVRDPAGKYPDVAFFDTDIDAANTDTILRYTRRWSTEITNRETKGLLGSSDSQCRPEKSVTRTPLMAYWSYCLLVVWFVKQFRMGKDLLTPRPPWYLKKKNITFSDMLAAARRSHFTQRVSRDHRKHQNLTKTIPTRYNSEQGFSKMAKL